MKHVRETLLGMVDTMTDAKRRVARPTESLRKASHLRGVQTFAMFTARAAPYRRENAREYLKMAGSFRFWHSSRGLEKTFNSPLKMGRPPFSHVQHFHPLRGDGAAEHRRPTRAVGDGVGERSASRCSPADRRMVNSKRRCFTQSR
jgi:hypothetical protein